MEKIKSVLHGNRKSEDATRDSHESSTSPQHPIYDEMTGHKEVGEGHEGRRGKEGTLTAAGGPYAQVQTTSGEPYTTLAQPGAESLKAEHIGTDGPLTGSNTTSGPVGASKTTSGGHLGSSHTTTGEHVGTSKTTFAEPLGSSSTATGGVVDSSKTTSGEPHISSHSTSGGHLGDSSTTSRGPIGTLTTTFGGLLRPDAAPTGKDSVNTGISDASIKSGVIGFGPSEGHGHAAYPTQLAPEKNLDRNQVVGGGDLETSEAAVQKDSRPATESQTLPRMYLRSCNHPFSRGVQKVLTPEHRL